MEWPSIIEDAKSILESKADLKAALSLLNGYCIHYCSISGKPVPSIDIFKIESDIVEEHGNTMIARQKFLDVYIDILDRHMFTDICTT